MKKNYRILMIHNRTGSLYYRLEPIALALEAEGHEVRLHKWDEMVLADEILWSDIVVLEMVFSPEVLDMIKALGRPIIYEMDDVMDEVGKTHPAYKEMTPLRKKMTREAIAKADFVTVTTQELKDRYTPLNKNITVLPNFLEERYWARPYRKNMGSKIRLGWGGSVSHRPDLEFIHPVIKRLLEKNKNLKFVYVGDGGYGKDWTSFNFSEDQFPDIPLDRKEYHVGVLPHVWADRIASLQLDIAIAPLLESKWNSAKSTCKYLEYAINKVPAVYAKWHYGWKRESGEPYVKDGVTGLLADEDPKDWENKIQLLIDSEKTRRRIADAAYADVTINYLFKMHKQRWLDVYNQAFEMSKTTKKPTNMEEVKSLLDKIKRV